MRMPAPRSVSSCTVLDLFDERVRERPSAVAVGCAGITLTFAELAGCATRLARDLRAHGVGVESRVAICAPPSVERIVAMVAILKAGGAYVALERAWPVPHQLRVLADLAPQAIVATAELAHRFASVDAPLLLLRPDCLVATPEPMDWTPDLTPDNLAYITYTSGTTGRPKGVAIPHRGVVRLVSVRGQIDQSPHDVVLHVAPLAFDASTFEIWSALLNGGRLEVFPPDLDLREIATVATRVGVTTMLFSAGLFHALVDACPDACGHHRQVLAGGDVISASHVRQTLLAGCRRFVNGYGPAENTTFTTFGVIEHVDDVSDPVPIGTALPGTEVYLLDAALGDTGGGPGELWTSGDGLARGYFNDAAQTAERFRPNPFSSLAGARMYGTGDRASQEQGRLIFLGRVDSQVKVRGFRIELEEVTALLRRCPAVADAAVIVEGQAAHDKRLVGFVTPSAASEELAADVREWLVAHAPDHLVPSEIVVLAALPLTTNGKVDRAMLAARYRAAGQQVATVAPRDALEILLVQLCERVLDSGPVGVRDNFFERGGRSIQALAFVGAIERTFGAKIPLPMIAPPHRLEDVANLLRRGGAAPPEARLVELVAADGPPIFWIHPAGGSVLMYWELCRKLGPEWRSYGLQCLDSDRLARPSAATLEGLAAEYITEVRRVCRDGPYNLAGWSMGGMIAFEMARQLRLAGAEVAFVGVIDAGPSESAHDEAFADVDAADVLLMQAHHFEPEVLRQLEQQPAATRFARAIELAREHHVVPLDVTAEQLEQRAELFRRNVLLHTRYRPQPYDGRVDLFRAADGISEAAPLRLGWDAVVRGPLQVHVVPGEHYSLPYEPHVRSLAAACRECLTTLVSAASTGAA